MHNFRPGDLSLRRALNFTEEDLAANRQGQMTNPQLFHLIRRTVGLFLAVSVVMTAALTLFSRFKIFWPIVGYYSVLFLVMMPWLAFTRHSVKAVEGELAKSEESTGDPREPKILHLKVRGLDFTVTDDVFRCFVSGLHYRIFYTALGKLVVAAEEIDPPPMRESSSAWDKEAEARLRAAFDITDDDLTANRAGRITLSQSARLLLNAADMPLLKAAVPMIVFGGLGTALFAGRFSIVSMIAPIFLILGGIQLVIVLPQFPWRDILRRAADRVEGPLSKEETPERCILKIQETALAVPDHVFNVFEDGHRYRIFYAQFSQKVVAAERLE